MDALQNSPGAVSFALARALAQERRQTAERVEAAVEAALESKGRALLQEQETARSAAAEVLRCRSDAEIRVARAVRREAEAAADARRTAGLLAEAERETALCKQALGQQIQVAREACAEGSSTANLAREQIAVVAEERAALTRERDALADRLSSAQEGEAGLRARVEREAEALQRVELEQAQHAAENLEIDAQAMLAAQTMEAARRAQSFAQNAVARSRDELAAAKGKLLRAKLRAADEVAEERVARPSRERRQRAQRQATRFPSRRSPPCFVPDSPNKLPPGSGRRRIRPSYEVQTQQLLALKRRFASEAGEMQAAAFASKREFVLAAQTIDKLERRCALEALEASRARDARGGGGRKMERGRGSRRARIFGSAPAPLRSR